MKQACLMLNTKDRDFLISVFIAVLAKTMIFRMIWTAIISVVK
jgi:hypothetical protein